MTYEEALAIVRSEYETRREAAHCEVVKTGLTYDGCNGMCVTIYNYDDRGPVISDIGETQYFFFEVPKEEWEKLCAENGFEFNHYRIEKPFTCIDDLFEYIDFIDRISDKYFDLD
jgi:hypothetical protein